MEQGFSPLRADVDERPTAPASCRPGADLADCSHLGRSWLPITADVTFASVSDRAKLPAHTKRRCTDSIWPTAAQQRLLQPIQGFRVCVPKQRIVLPGD